MLVPATSPAGDKTGGEGSNGFRRFRFEQSTAKRTRKARATGDAVDFDKHRGPWIEVREGSNKLRL
jgi:hypothetical protein